jgi:hypothetical protein
MILGGHLCRPPRPIQRGPPRPIQHGPPRPIQHGPPRPIQRVHLVVLHAQSNVFISSSSTPNPTCSSRRPPRPIHPAVKWLLRHARTGSAKYGWAPPYIKCGVLQLSRPEKIDTMKLSSIFTLILQSPCT